jgi:nucleoside-diphosphate-sugar epimerase
LPESVDFVFYTAAAGKSDGDTYRAIYVEGVKHILQVLLGRDQLIKRFFYTSSTSVYGQQRGEWVNEDSPTEPTNFSGRLLLEGEQIVSNALCATTSIRFGGIYGPGRYRLIDRVKNGGACKSEPPLYTNRIHRDDCAGMLRHLFELDRPKNLYVGVDCEPATECEVMGWLAARLGVAHPECVGCEEGDMVWTRGNKRCDNARLLASGYQFRYPTFREGYMAVLQDFEPTGGILSP